MLLALVPFSPSLIALPSSAQAGATRPAGKTILITNVSILDATSEKLVSGTDVIVAVDRIDELIPSGKNSLELIVKDGKVYKNELQPDSGR